MAVLVKTSGRPEDVALSVAVDCQELDPDVLPDVQLLKTSFGQKLQQTELIALGVSLLGFSALLLACVGVVGLVAYSVAQRTKEIGIRMALGATGSHVLSVVLRQLSRPVAAGLLLGSAPPPRCRRSSGGSCTASATWIRSPIWRRSACSSRSSPSPRCGRRAARFASIRCTRFACD